MPRQNGVDRRFECTTDGHNKVWIIHKFRDPESGYKPHGFRTSWGKIGASLQHNDKTFASQWARDAAYNKLLSEKMDKGYNEIGTHSKAEIEPPTVDKPILIMPKLEPVQKSKISNGQAETVKLDEMPLVPKKKEQTDDPFLDRLGDLDL